MKKNLLTKSSDKNYTVHYRYGEDGQRALKYTEEGRSETLYFNNFFTIHIPIYDKDNPQGLRVHKHIFVGNSRLVTAMTHTDNHGDNDEQKEKRYYYHSDHLGSAQFVTDWRGKQYEHIEYTPYGELWTYKSKTAKLFLATYNNFLAKQPSGLIEATAPGIDKLPFRFTGKELDEETGLYYYGARYLDPKYSRWLSGDPALNDYIPKAPIDDEAKKHNENLPGMGGVFNVVNLHVYHYAGNNPVKYIDPDGRSDEYTIDGDYIGHINDNIDGIHVVEFTYVGSATSRKDSHGYLKNQDGSIMSASDFNNIVALIFAEAKLANGVNEAKGMGEVIKNRMNETGLSSEGVLNHPLAGFDGLNTRRFFMGLDALKSQQKGAGLPQMGFGEDRALANAIAGAIYGLSGNNFMTDGAMFWSHKISRSDPFIKTISIGTADFFKLSNEWIQKQGGRQWP